MKKLLLDLLRNYMRLLKWPFSMSFLLNFPIICMHMLSKFTKKFIRKWLIFPGKANYARDLFIFLSLTLNGGFLLAAEKEELPQVKPYSLLTFSKNLPITLDENNEANLKQDESQRNQELAHFKSLPWKETLGLLTFLACLYFIKNAEHPPSEAQIKQRILTSRQKALASLDAIKTESLPVEEYYQKLSDTVRAYIEERTEIRAPHYTTQEFLLKMQNSPFFPTETQQALSEFLINSDKVKFARYQPHSEEWEKTFQVAKHFIET